MLTVDADSKTDIDAHDEMPIGPAPGAAKSVQGGLRAHGLTERSATGTGKTHGSIEGPSRLRRTLAQWRCNAHRPGAGARARAAPDRKRADGDRGCGRRPPGQG